MFLAIGADKGKLDELERLNGLYELENASLVEKNKVLWSYIAKIKGWADDMYQVCVSDPNSIKTEIAGMLTFLRIIQDFGDEAT